MPISMNSPLPTFAASDAELVLMARDGGPASPATRALYDRLAPALRRFVGWLVSTGVLPAADAEDATQEAALAFFEALDHFRPGGPDWGDGDRFRAFLRRVVRDWLAKWRRALRREESRLDRSRDAEKELDKRAARGEADQSPWRAGDPAALAEWGEFWGRLEEALGRLGDEARRLWDARTGDGRLRALADETGQSYDQAKRRWGRLRAALRRALGGGGPERPRPAMAGRPAESAAAPKPVKEAPMTPSAEAFNAASGLREAGRRQEAEDALRALLAADPGMPRCTCWA